MSDPHTPNAFNATALSGGHQLQLTFETGRTSFNTGFSEDSELADVTLKADTDDASKLYLDQTQVTALQGQKRSTSCAAG